MTIVLFAMVGMCIPLVQYKFNLKPKTWAWIAICGSMGLVIILDWLGFLDKFNALILLAIAGLGVLWLIIRSATTPETTTLERTTPERTTPETTIGPTYPRKIEISDPEIIEITQLSPEHGTFSLW